MSSDYRLRYLRANAGNWNELPPVYFGRSFKLNITPTNGSHTAFLISATQDSYGWREKVVLCRWRIPQEPRGLRFFFASSGDCLSLPASLLPTSNGISTAANVRISLGSKDYVKDRRLYRFPDKLSPHKDALKIHMKNRMDEFLHLEYALPMYDRFRTEAKIERTSSWFSAAA